MINHILRRNIHINKIVIRSQTQLVFIVMMIIIALIAIKHVTLVMAQMILNAYLVKAYIFIKILALKPVPTASMLYQRHGIVKLIAL